jgi:hypothetical protein
MDQMAPMTGIDQNAMRQQMMERMHSCMEGMMDASGMHRCGAMKENAGPNQSDEHKPASHDHSGKDAEPGH